VEKDLEENVFNDPKNSVMGGALKSTQSIEGLPVIGIDETVHDLPAHEDPPDEPVLCDQDPVFPGLLKVICEDDIIAARAFIVYENCLRQLATFLILPVEKCTGVLRTAYGRNDSPGHCAQYCSYTTMENDTKEIIHVATIDKRQTLWNSVVMEKEGFIQTMDKLTSEVNVVEICKDAHAQIGALMNPEKGKYKALGILHSLDMWHGAKNLAKKIAAVSATRE
ncbi:hypothetical protein IRJ41_022089, partial [Triplophysa rosa]